MGLGRLTSQAASSAESVTNALPPTQPAAARTDPTIMVEPAASSVADARRTPSNPADKPKNQSTLQPKFAALLASARAPAGASLGQWAYFGRGTTQRVEGGPGAIQVGLPVPVRHRAADDPTALDPLARSLAVPAVALLSAPVALGPAPATNVAVNEFVAFEEAVRRVAWGGDRRRGVARIELGGEYAGTSIIIRGEGRELSLRVEVAPGCDARDLPARLVERLEARGLCVTELEVR